MVKISAPCFQLPAIKCSYKSVPLSLFHPPRTRWQSLPNQIKDTVSIPYFAATAQRAHSAAMTRDTHSLEHRYLVAISLLSVWVYDPSPKVTCCYLETNSLEQNESAEANNPYASPEIPEFRSESATGSHPKPVKPRPHSRILFLWDLLQHLHPIYTRSP
jgi:hypothetical protein